MLNRMNATLSPRPRGSLEFSAPPALISVAIVEGNTGVREGLAALINGTSGFRCTGAFPDAETALQQLRGHWPDVLLMDIHLPNMSGISGVARLKAQRPTLQILVLTVCEDADEILESFMAGASGYLVKPTPPAEVLEAIAEVHQGGAPMSGQIARKVVEYFQKKGHATGITGTVSKRELEVLTLLAKGFRYKEIADQLAISVLTVRSHLQRIYVKLHVRSRTEAVLIFLDAKHLL